jgi:hypothetical protein
LTDTKYRATTLNNTHTNKKLSKTMDKSKDNLKHKNKNLSGVIYMRFLRWLGGIVVFFWILGFLFKVGGNLIHVLLIIAAVVFIYDRLIGKR